MSVKDSVAGTAKQLLAEIVGDGKLAEEGSRQAAAGATSDPVGAADSSPSAQQAPQRNEPGTRLASPGDENRFAGLLGRAALKVWADLPRDAQERLFAAAVDEGAIATDLAEFLHDRHPRTAHPPRPTRFA